MPPTTTALYTEGITLFNAGEPFDFTDPRPQMFIFGHIEVDRQNRLVEDVGALNFYADDYDSNVGFFDGASGHNEAVTFVSGNWFAGRLYAGRPSLDELQDLSNPQPAADDDRSIPGNAVNLKDALRNIQSNRRNLIHRRLPLERFRP